MTVSVHKDWLCLSDAKRLLYGVPQGSELGLILLSLYITPLNSYLKFPGISFHFYVELYVHLTHKHVTEAFDSL